MTVIIVILIIIGFFVFVVANSGKKEENEPYVNHKYDLLLQNEIEKTKPKNIYKQTTFKTYENISEFEVTGIHIDNRKKYISENCSENDDVKLKHEKNNPYSNRAIVVKHLGKTIGYIAEYDVEEVHEILITEFEAKISEIDFDGNYLTVRINIEH